MDIIILNLMKMHCKLSIKLTVYLVGSEPFVYKTGATSLYVGDKASKNVLELIRPACDNGMSFLTKYIVC